MAIIQINKFEGIMPKIANDKLPETSAQIANSMKTATGELVPYKNSTADVLLAGSDYKTFFEYLEGGNTHWVYYDAIVHFARSPVANDEFERMYSTGSEVKFKAFVNDLISGTFDFTTDFYYPGAPSAVAPVISYTTGGTYYRAYFYTYVSRYGEEGPPSALVETVDANGVPDWDGSSNPVLGPFVEPDAADGHLKGAAVGGNSATIRIYRTSAAQDGTAEFLLVDEITIDATGPASTAWATYTYTDTQLDTELGSACQSTTYDRAVQGMSGLRPHPNGFFVGFKDNVLYFSEPYKPFAWPEDYQLTVDGTIIGIGIFESTIVVATDGHTITFSGPHPTNLYKTRLGFNPCLSQRALVETDKGVMFPTLEGFQRVDTSGINNITRDLFKPDDWDEYALDTMHGAWYNDAYYGFFKSADYEGGLILDFLNSNVTTNKQYHYASYVAVLDGKFRTIYPADLTDTSNLYIAQWDNDGEAYRNFQWKSKLFSLTKPKNFKVAQITIDDEFYANLLEIIADTGDLETANQAAWDETDFGIDLDGPLNQFTLNGQDMNGDTLLSLSSIGIQDYIEFRIYVDRTLKWTRQVTTGKMFKLPRGFKDKKWEFELVGMIPVKRLTIATSTDEIVGANV